MNIGARNKDPYLSHRFVVEIDGLIVGGCSEVSGLLSEIETEEYREGGVNDHVHKLPKIAKHPNLTLKRGVTDLPVFWVWHQAAVSGKILRKNVRVILLDAEGHEVLHWMFEDAYPIKWTGPDFKADSNTIAFESLELAHHGIKKG
jgi:phage tail-like protein